MACKPEDGKWDEIAFVELGASQIEIKSTKDPVLCDGSVHVGIPRFCSLAEDLKEKLAFLKNKGVEAMEPLHNVSGPNGIKLKLVDIKGS